VTQLVREDSNNFLRGALLNQGVVDNNVLLPWQAEEICIAVCRPLAAIDDVQLGKGELETLGQCLNTGFQLTRLEGRQLVEQWENRDRVDCDHEDLKTSAEQPEVVEELVARLLDDLEEAGENWRRKDDREHIGLDHIRNECLWCSLVEAKLLLKDKGAVNRGWE
jgi:hypothetical protein